MTTDIDKRLIARAILIYRKKGWMQGRFWNPERTSCCIVGALLEAADIERVAPAWPTVEVVTKAMRRKYPGRFNTASLSAWNDGRAKDKQEVLNLLKTAMDS